MNIKRIKNLLKSVAPKPLLVWGKDTPGTFYPASDFDDITGLNKEVQK